MADPFIVSAFGAGILNSSKRLAHAATLLGGEPIRRIAVVDTIDTAAHLYHTLKESHPNSDWQIARTDQRAIYTDDHGINVGCSYSWCETHLLAGGRLIIPGSETRSLSKNAPLLTVDPLLSGAIFATGAKAESFECWTETTGFSRASPSMVDNPRGIPHLSLWAAREIALLDERVVSASVLKPLCEQGILTRIGHIDHTPGPTTTLWSSRPRDEPAAAGIACKGGYWAMTIRSLGMHERVGALVPLFQALARVGLPFEYMATGHDVVNVIMRYSDHVPEAVSSVRDSLARTLPDLLISIESGLAVLAVVGERLEEKKYVARRVHEIVESGSPYVIPLGAYGSPSLLYCIPESALNDVVRTLYDELY